MMYYLSDMETKCGLWKCLWDSWAKVRRWGGEKGKEKSWKTSSLSSKIKFYTEPSFTAWRTLYNSLSGPKSEEQRAAWSPYWLAHPHTESASRRKEALLNTNYQAHPGWHGITRLLGKCTRSSSVFLPHFKKIISILKELATLFSPLLASLGTIKPKQLVKCCIKNLDGSKVDFNRFAFQTY